MAMDEFLAQYYGTAGATKTASANEDTEKQASVDLFMKLAADQNIDLSSMPAAQVDTLYANWVKAASEDGEEDEKEEKEEEAKKEHEKKKATAEKVAEADFLGRVMAHAMVNEQRNIKEAAAAGKLPKFLRKVNAETLGLAAGYRAGQKVHHGAGRAIKAVGKHVRDAGEYVGEHARNAGEYVGEHARNAGDFARRAAKKHPGVTHGAAAAAGIGAGVGGAHLLHSREKEASAIDELAAERAVKLAYETGFDAEECGHRIGALFTLGVQGESEKVAAAPDAHTAVDVRALELLETAGYPVTWNE